MAKPKKSAKPVPELVLEGSEPKKATKGPPTVDSIMEAQKNLLYRGRAAPNLQPEPVPTGLYELDRYVTGIGGLPRGRIVEVIGGTSSGKTTLCLRTIAAAQASGLTCAFIDAEHALDGNWAEFQGVNLETLVVGKPEWGEQALDLLEDLIETFQVGLIVVDSVAALTPKKEIEGDMGDSSMGMHAKLMSQALRKLVSIVEKSNTCVVFTNQYRSGMSSFGPQNVPTGGNALKFYASLRLETTNIGKLKVGEAEEAEVLGNEIRITALKNKMAPPWRVSKVPLMYDRGYDNLANMFELAVKNELECIKKISSVMWDVFGQSARGRAAAIETCRNFEAELKQALDAYYDQGLLG